MLAPSRAWRADGCGRGWGAGHSWTRGDTGQLLCRIPDVAWDTCLVLWAQGPLLVLTAQPHGVASPGCRWPIRAGDQLLG